MESFAQHPVSTDSKSSPWPKERIPEVNEASLKEVLAYVKSQAVKSHL